MSDDPRGVEARRLTTPLLDRGFLRSTAPADADEILRLAHERGLAGPPDETQWAPSSPTPSGKRQKDPSPGQPSVSLILARGGTSLRQAIARMHNPSESYVRQMIDEYIRDTADHPEVKRLHDQAIADRPALLAESEEREARNEAARRDKIIGQQKAADTAAALKARLPYPLQARGAVATVAEPVAESALAGVGVVAMFVPYVSQALIALNALEVAVGYRLDPFPGIPQIVMDITSGRHPGAGTLRHLGEKIEIDERVLNGLFLAIVSARAIIRAGSAGLKAIVEQARKLRASAQDLESFTVRLAALEKDMVTLREAVALARAGKPLSSSHLRAIARAKQALGGPLGGTITRGTADQGTTGRLQADPRRATPTRGATGRTPNSRYSAAKRGIGQAGPGIKAQSGTSVATQTATGSNLVQRGGPGQPIGMIRRGGSGPKTIVTAGRDIVPNGDHAGLSKQQWGEFVNGEKRFGFSWDGDNLVVHKSSGTSPNAFPPTQQDISYIVKELQNSGLEFRFIFIDVGKKYMKIPGNL